MLFQRSEPLKEFPWSTTKTNNNTQSNKSSIALKTLETTDVTTVEWTTLSIMWELLESIHGLHIHMSDTYKTANSTRDSLESTEPRQSVIATVWPMLWQEDQLLWLLMDKTSKITDREFSTTVEQTCHWLFCWLEWVTVSGFWRTHGEYPGEKTDTSDSPEETPVVYAWQHLIQLYDLLSITYWIN